MNTAELREVIVHLDRELSHHGYIVSRASESALSQPCKDSRFAGDHCRWMLAQALTDERAGEIGRTIRWFRFAQGIAWALGVRSLEEIRNLEEEDYA